MAPTTRSRAAAARKIFKYPSLPTELRLMIWRQTFEPRILHIISETRDYIYDSDHMMGPVYYHIRFKARESPPIALQVSRESRALALKHYTPSFHSVTHPADPRGMKPTAIYFNPHLDTVRVAEESNMKNNLEIFLPFTDEETIRIIKTLAIGGQLFHKREWWRDYTAGRLPAYESLETLILVAEDETAGDERKSSILADMEDRLVKAKDKLVSQGEQKEWKLPAVKVVARSFDKWSSCEWLTCIH